MNKQEVLQKIQLATVDLEHYMEVGQFEEADRELDYLKHLTYLLRGFI